jgi:hypothetical protein
LFFLNYFYKDILIFFNYFYIIQHQLKFELAPPGGTNTELPQDGIGVVGGGGVPYPR